MSLDPTNPSQFFGGTWERVEGKFLLGASDSYDAGSEGGEETHTLTESEMPSHTHSIIGHYSGGSDYSSTVERTVEYNNERKGWWLGDDLILRAGNGKAHNNMPPYLVVYMWVRIA